MREIITKYEFVNKERYLEIIKEFENVEHLDLKESGIFAIYDDKNLSKNNFNSSIGIASAVTSYLKIKNIFFILLRTYMSQFKNSDKFRLFYSDTDSIFIDQELDESLIGNEIGQFKLEYKVVEGVFLGPKIYAVKCADGKYICKVKGYKDSINIPFQDMKSLLIKNSKPLELKHSLWFRNKELEEINIMEQMYNLIATENKRLFIYDKNNFAVDTVAFKLSS